MLLVQWTLGTSWLPLSPRKPEAYNFISQSAEHEIWHGLNWQCKGWTVFKRDGAICTFISTLVLEQHEVVWVVPVRFVLQLVSVDSISLSPTWAQIADQCCVFLSAVRCCSHKFSGNSCMFHPVPYKAQDVLSPLVLFLQLQCSCKQVLQVLTVGCPMTYYKGLQKTWNCFLLLY